MSMPISNSSSATFKNNHNIDINDGYLLSGGVDSSTEGRRNMSEQISSKISGTVDNYHHQNNTKSLSHMSLLSPLRKMDFALCKYYTLLRCEIH